MRSTGLFVIVLLTLTGCLDDPALDAELSGVGDGDKKILLYGNYRAWGSLGLGPGAKMWESVHDVVDKFGEMCAEKRAAAGVGEEVPCQADLITLAPNGMVLATEEVATRLIETHGARISIDFRPNSKLSYAEIEQYVDWITSGKEIVHREGGSFPVLSREFLEAHPIGLSLDFEPQVVEAQNYPSADIVNRICNTYRTNMEVLGHDPALTAPDCFLYEFGWPPMVWNPGSVEPWIYPVLMSRVTRERAIAELRRDGIEETDESILTRSLEIKKRWIDNIDQKYASTDVTGCMFVEAPYLIEGNRDHFSFKEGLAAFGDKCDIYSFQ